MPTTTAQVPSPPDPWSIIGGGGVGAGAGPSNAGGASGMGAPAGDGAPSHAAATTGAADVDAYVDVGGGDVTTGDGELSRAPAARMTMARPVQPQLRADTTTSTPRTIASCDVRR